MMVEDINLRNSIIERKVKPGVCALRSIFQPILTDAECHWK